MKPSSEMERPSQMKIGWGTQRSRWHCMKHARVLRALDYKFMALRPFFNKHKCQERNKGITSSASTFLVATPSAIMLPISVATSIQPTTFWWRDVQGMERNRDFSAGLKAAWKARIWNPVLEVDLRPEMRMSDETPKAIWDNARRDVSVESVNQADVTPTQEDDIVNAMES